MPCSPPRARLNAALLLLLLGIWSVVAVRLMHEARPSRPAALPDSATTDLPPTAHRAGPPYRADFRDPFAPPAPLFAAHEPYASPSPTPEPTSSDAPLLRLHGIVGRTALVRDRRGMVHLVAPGDTLSGTHILTVDAESVRIAYGAQRLSIGLY